MKSFFEKILPPSGIKFLASPRGDGYIHEAFEDLDAMAARAYALASLGKDVYFACASYAEPSYVDEKGITHWRTGKNAKHVKSFWVDVDVGENKIYQTQLDAVVAIKSFCDFHKIPTPMVLSSGYGLHCYWPLEQEISKAVWKTTAAKLRALMKVGAHPLMADHSKTADVAAILRPAGTLNFKKLADGVRVTVLRSKRNNQFAEFEKSVSDAHARLQPALSQLTQSQTAIPLDVPPLVEMAEALSHIDPDGRGRIDWWNILAALADAYGEQGRDLAMRWSRRELMNGVSTRYDEEDFQYQYSDCLDRDYEGKRTGIGTIVQLARQGGWTGSFSTSLDWLANVNTKYAWIEKEASIYRIETGTFMSNEAFRTQYCNRFVEVASGEGVKAVPMGSKWLQHPGRREHHKLVMRPGEREVTEDNCLNTWQGFSEEPKNGDIRPFIQLLKRLIPDPHAAGYVLQWMTHLLQHPGIKMHTALVIWSHTQGVGKNLLFECLKSIIGERHATIIGQAELSRDFNEWAKDKILVIGDEVSGSDKREHEDKLKGLITGVGSSRVDLQACKLEYSIVSPK